MYQTLLACDVAGKALRKTIPTNYAAMDSGGAIAEVCVHLTLKEQVMAAKPVDYVGRLKSKRILYGFP